MNKKDEPSKEVLLAMLGSALIEIRASNDLKLSQALADIFHNLPKHIAYKWDEHSCEKAYATILRKASKWKLRNYILTLRENAEGRFPNEE